VCGSYNGSFGVGGDTGQRAGPEWKVFSEPAQAIGDAEPLEVPRFFSLSRALLVAIQCETESTLS
jgi:hypothetical protein